MSFVWLALSARVSMYMEKACCQRRLGLSFGDVWRALSANSCIANAVLSALFSCMCRQHEPMEWFSDVSVHTLPRQNMCAVCEFHSINKLRHLSLSPLFCATSSFLCSIFEHSRTTFSAQLHLWKPRGFQSASRAALQNLGIVYAECHIMCSFNFIQG